MDVGVVVLGRAVAIIMAIRQSTRIHPYRRIRLQWVRASFFFF